MTTRVLSRGGIYIDADGDLVCHLDGWIGGGEFNLDRVRDALAVAGPTGEVWFHIDSKGGNAADALAIARLIRSHRGWTRAEVGDHCWCCSGAVTVLAAARWRIGRRTSRYMVHHATHDRKFCDAGDAAAVDFDAVRFISGSTRVSPLVLSRMMDRSQWLSAVEACAFGLLSEVK